MVLLSPFSVSSTYFSILDVHSQHFSRVSQARSVCLRDLCWSSHTWPKCSLVKQIERIQCERFTILLVFENVTFWWYSREQRVSIGSGRRYICFKKPWSDRLSSLVEMRRKQVSEFMRNPKITQSCEVPGGFRQLLLHIQDRFFTWFSIAFSVLFCISFRVRGSFRKNDGSQIKLM